ncbi:hypothetical protein KKE03_04590 [Patescibacteria group bacterium]|nr:hypothetical protein [Patescibacteria group bacterium]
MAIQQTKHQTDLEKRLHLLRRQVYGKNSNQSSARLPDGQAISYQLSDTMQNKSDDRRLTAESYSDLTYLHQDLLKILVFASLAIGIQAVLFFLSKNHILNINFF